MFDLTPLYLTILIGFNSDFYLLGSSNKNLSRVSFLSVMMLSLSKSPLSLFSSLASIVLSFFMTSLRGALRCFFSMPITLR